MSHAPAPRLRARRSTPSTCATPSMMALTPKRRTSLRPRLLTAGPPAMYPGPRVVYHRVRPRVLGCLLQPRDLGLPRVRAGGPLSRLVALRACCPQRTPRWSRMAMPPQGLGSSFVRVPPLHPWVLGGLRAWAGGLSCRIPARGASRPQSAHPQSQSACPPAWLMDRFPAQGARAGHMVGPMNLIPLPVKRQR